MGWHERRTRNPADQYFDRPGTPEADRGERDVWHLYGPRGEVLATFSDRPPTGFHQGERGESRR